MGGVGTEGMEVKLATDRHPETKHKRSKIAFAFWSIMLCLEPLKARLLKLSAQTLKLVGENAFAQIGGWKWTGEFEGVICFSKISSLPT